MNLKNIKIYHTGVPAFLTRDAYTDEPRYNGNILIPLESGRSGYRYAQWINEDGDHYCNLSIVKFRAFCQLLPTSAHVYEYDKDFKRKREKLLKTIESCKNTLEVAKVVAKFCIK